MQRLTGLSLGRWRSKKNLMTNSAWDMQNKWQRAEGELEILDRVMSHHTNM